jgi:hypothetical protein
LAPTVSNAFLDFSNSFNGVLLYLATITVLSEIDETTKASLNPSNGGQSKIIISKSFFNF